MRMKLPLWILLLSQHIKILGSFVGFVQIHYLHIIFAMRQSTNWYEAEWETKWDIIVERRNLSAFEKGFDEIDAMIAKSNIK